VPINKNNNSYEKEKHIKQKQSAAKNEFLLEEKQKKTKTTINLCSTEMLRSGKNNICLKEKQTAAEKTKCCSQER